MMNLLRPAFFSRWMLVLTLAGGYCCCGCWHDHHDDHDGGGWRDDHHDYHDDHHDHEYHDHY